MPDGNRGTGPKDNGMEPVEIVVGDDNERTLKYIYKAKSTLKKDVKPLVLVAGCTCPYPTENFPYREQVFKYLREIGPLVKKYSALYGVPAIAVAGSIADEYNTRFMPGYSAVKRGMDTYQDITLPSTDVSQDDHLNAVIEHQYQALKQRDPGNTHRTDLDRLLLMNAAGDYGKGNISLRTAIDLHGAYPGDCPRMTRIQLVRYLTTDEGTTQYAALYVREAQGAMGRHLDVLPQRKREAVLVTYYKRGGAYYTNFLKDRGRNPVNKLRAWEGCRVCFQRKAIGEAIGVSVDSFEVVKQ